MGKVPAILGASALLVFTFLWYQANINTECVGPSICSRSASQGGNKVTRNQNVNISRAGSEGTAGKDRVEISYAPLEVKGSSDTERAETNGTVHRDTADVTGGSVETGRTADTKVRHGSRQQLTVTEHVGNANTTKINSLETEPVPGDRHIIFIETVCLLDGTYASGYLGLSLHKRQACVIESAAKMNPDHKVYLLYSCPINGRLENSSEHVLPIFSYPNVRLWRLNLTNQLYRTPLEKWNYRAAMALSSWPKEHSSDVLRLLALWKYGGTYLDLDVVILRSLGPLGTNYVGLESPTTVANCVLSFDSGGIGHAVADRCVDQIRANFRGHLWTYNGPDLITRVLLAMCHTSHVAELTTGRCKGFQVLSNKEFFPIPYQDWELFFDETESQETMQKIQGSFGVHVWNKLSKQTAVLVGSKQPYSLMAERTCPRVYSACGRDF